LTLCHPLSGRRLQVYTDQPSAHLYSANLWPGDISGVHPHKYQKHGALAIETQAFPDAPNHASFPDTVLTSRDLYQANTIFEFDII
jgi:aldose 1-epimerase